MGNACQASASTTAQGRPKSNAQVTQIKAVGFSASANGGTINKTAAGSKPRCLRRVGNFPKIDNYYESNANESQAKEAIKSLLATKKGFLLVSGDEGVGVTCLFAKLLGGPLVKSSLINGNNKSAEDFVWHDCPQVELVIWLNAGGSKKRIIDDEHILNCVMARLLDGTANDDDDGDSSSQLRQNMWKDFAKMKPGSVLLVADLGHHRHHHHRKEIIQLKTHRVVKVIAIHGPEIDLTSGVKVPVISCEIKRRSEQECVQLLSKPVASEAEQQTLAAVSRGLPLILRPLQTLLSDQGETRDSFSKIFDSLKSAETSLGSVKSILALEKPEIVDKILAFVLFDAETPVDSSDLALLWSLGRAHDAETFCKTELLSRGLVQSVAFHNVEKQDPPSSKTAKLDKRRYFSMPRLIHEAISKEASKFSAFIKEAGRKSPSAQPGENILHLAIRLKRQVLLKSLVANVEPGDLAALFEWKTSRLDSASIKDSLFEANKGRRDRKFAKSIVRLWDTILGENFEKFKNELFNKFKENQLNSLLLLAAKTGCEHLLKAVLATRKVSKIDAFDPKDIQQLTALMLASARGHLQIVRVLLENKADPNVVSGFGTTTIYLAAKHGDVEVVKLLSEKGADPNLPLQNSSLHQQFGINDFPVISAARHGNLACFNYLLTHKTIVTPGMKNACLYLASKHGHLEIVTALLRGNSDDKISAPSLDAATNDEARTALMAAAENGHQEVVKLLLENGANSEICDKENRNALALAILSGQVAVVECLAEKLMRAKQAVNEAKLFEAVKDWDEEAVKSLLDGGVDVNSCENGVMPVLDIAVQTGQVSMAEILLKRGANPIDHKNESALAKAVASKNVELVEMLLKNGAKPNLASEKTGAPLLIAISSGNAEIVDVLLKAKADPNAKHPREGVSALIMAVRGGNEAIVKALLNTGRISDSDVEAALKIAEKRAAGAVLEMLVDYDDNKKAKKKKK